MMLGAQSGFAIALLGLLITGALVWKRLGVHSALGIIVAMSFALPVWLEISIGEIPIRIQSAVAIAGLLALTLLSPRKILSPIVFLDVVIAGLVVLQVLSDTNHGVSGIVSGFQAYGEWALPYAAGRYAAYHFKALEPLGFCICGVLIILMIGGFFEAFSGTNLWEVVFGERPLEGFQRDASRFGFKRAYGTTLHPIFFGLLVITLAPWSLALWKWTEGDANRSFASLSLVAITGALASLSRGPVLALGMFCAFVGAVWNKWLRYSFLAVSVLFAIWLVTDFNGFLVVLDTIGGEERRQTNLVLDGERIDLSSTTHRVWQLKVYWPALREAGWLGYGSVAVSSLPPDVPYLPSDENTRSRIKYVDNAFMMFGLRFGWSGIILFSLLLIAGVWTGLKSSKDRSVGVIAVAIASMLVGLGGALFTVWLSYDMGFEVLWSLGVLGGIASSQKEMR